MKQKEEIRCARCGKKGETISLTTPGGGTTKPMCEKCFLKTIKEVAEKAKGQML